MAFKCPHCGEELPCEHMEAIALKDFPRGKDGTLLVGHLEGVPLIVDGKEPDLSKVKHVIDGTMLEVASRNKAVLDSLKGEGIDE